MNWRRHFVEAATLIVAAVVCALVSNAAASRERKLVVVSTLASGGQRAASGLKPAPTPSIPPPPGAAPTTDNRQPVTTLTTTRQPEKPKQPTTDNRQPIDRFPPHPDKAYVELHGDDVAWLHSKGVLFLDARRTSVFEPTSRGCTRKACSFSMRDAHRSLSRDTFRGRGRIQCGKPISTRKSTNSTPSGATREIKICRSSSTARVATAKTRTCSRKSCGGFSSIMFTFIRMVSPIGRSAGCRFTPD